jgi:uncharacterized membrane protein YeaQ/YmgE (transglycosylase-associated protein family)
MAAPCMTNTLKGEVKMNFIIWLIVGGILGWLASIFMRTNGQQGMILNIVVGIVGAFVAGLVLTPMLGIGTINQNNFSLPGLLVSFVGAIILLAVVSLFRRGSFR